MGQFLSSFTYTFTPHANHAKNELFVHSFPFFCRSHNCIQVILFLNADSMEFKSQSLGKIIEYPPFYHMAHDALLHDSAFASKTNILVLYF